MNKISAAVLILSAALLTACANQKPVDRPPFPIDEYAQLQTVGTGKVAGQVFMKTVGGDVRFGAGSDVYLFPGTSYSDFWYQTNYVSQKPIAPPDSRQMQYTKIVQADGSGNFEFSDIPPGRYYISSMVTWQAPTQWGLAAQGGWVAKSATVSNGATARVMLTR